MVEETSQGDPVGVHGLTEYGMGVLGHNWPWPTPRHPPTPLAPLLWDEGEWKDGIVVEIKGV